MTLWVVNLKNQFKANSLTIVMPLKEKKNYNEYMKMYMKIKRDIKINKRQYDNIMKDLTIRCYLPRHIYEFKNVLRQMLLDYFKKKYIVVRRRTDLIQPYYI